MPEPGRFFSAARILGGFFAGMYRAKAVSIRKSFWILREAFVFAVVVMASEDFCRDLDLAEGIAVGDRGAAAGHVLEEGGMVVDPVTRIWDMESMGMIPG